MHLLGRCLHVVGHVPEEEEGPGGGNGEQLREVAEIVGAEGLQDADRLLMYIAEQIRKRFLCQNSFTDDAFSAPASTFEVINNLVNLHDSCLARIKRGESLEVILKELQP